MNKSVTLLDGGMGQDLIRRSGKPPTPLWSAQVMLDTPELVEDLHIEHIKAGAKLITLNNYVATPARLTRDASLDLFDPIHAAAKDIARSARHKSGATDILISGCLPPIMASFKPELTPSAEICLTQYRALVAVQKDAIDIISCETMATIREAVAAVTAAREVGLRTLVSFTLDDKNPNTLRSGELLVDAVKAVAPLGVEAVTVNCSAPETLKAVMPLLVQNFPKVGGAANGFQSVSPLKAGGTTAALLARTDLTPQTYAAYALGWADVGAKLIGGCCEVGPAHIAEMRRVFLAAKYDLVTF